MEVPPSLLGVVGALFPVLRGAIMELEDLSGRSGISGHGLGELPNQHGLERGDGSLLAVDDDGDGGRGVLEEERLDGFIAADPFRSPLRVPGAAGPEAGVLDRKSVV